jgi:hypothetical protein
MIDLEHQVQVAICQYLDSRGVLYFAIPNGGKRNVVTAVKLKKEGVVSGVPDLCVLNDGRVFFLEVKRPASTTGGKGRLSPAQKDMIARFEEECIPVKVVFSVADVIEACIDWRIL